jgi:hypothetical protein
MQAVGQAAIPDRAATKGSGEEGGSEADEDGASLEADAAQIKAQLNNIHAGPLQ